MNVLLYYGLIFFVLMGCTRESKDIEATLINLFNEEMELLCELQLMKGNISEAWDMVNVLLEQNPPDSMHEEKKANMMKARNASLIRMFEPFEGVSEEIYSSRSGLGVLLHRHRCFQ